MSLEIPAATVCQIPDCTTTQTEIEAELATFLASYCSVCKKDRNGKLCGCAFPCSLTFKSQMLNKIHELLGIPKPADRRAIQVIKNFVKTISRLFDEKKCNIFSNFRFASNTQIY